MSKEPAWMSTKPPWLPSWGEAASAWKTEYASVPCVGVTALLCLRSASGTIGRLSCEISKQIPCNPLTTKA